MPAGSGIVINSNDRIVEAPQPGDIAILHGDEYLSGSSDDTGRRAPTAGVFLLLGAIATAVLLLVAIPSLVPVRQEVQIEPAGSNAVTAVITDLRRAGAVVGVGSVPRSDTPLSVSGTELLVGQESVWLYEYPTVAAAAEDARAILAGELGLESSDVIQRSNILLVFNGVSAETRAILVEAMGPPLDQ